MPDPMLFQPFPMRSLTLRNRITVSPMCQYSSHDGFANDWHLVHLGSRASGGAGLVMAEATAVVPEGRISVNDLGLWKDDHIEALRRVASFVKSQGAVSAIQLAHAGRKGSVSRPWDGGKPLGPEAGGWQMVGPGDEPFSASFAAPRALTVGEIQGQVVPAFAAAARRALEAGFEVVEVHAAHGYLMHAFYSPLVNLRSDEYGGGFEGRTRLLREVVGAVREVWPDELPVWVRISATDWAEGGWSVEDSVRLAGVLKSLGVDVVDVSSGGGVHHQKIDVGPGYQVPFSRAIREGAGIATAAVGMITMAAQAEAILEAGDADLISLARAELRDAYWPMHAALELGMESPWQPQYERAKPQRHA